MTSVSFFASNITKMLQNLGLKTNYDQLITQKNRIGENL